MSEQIQPGKHNGRVINYGFKTTQAGDPAVVVEFKIDTGTESVNLSWQGSMKTDRKTPESMSAWDFTKQALEACGLVFDPATIEKDWNAMAGGVSSGVLDTDRDVQLTVEYKKSTSGYEYASISKVSKAGGAIFSGLLPAPQAVAMFKQNGFINHLVAEAQKEKMKPGFTPKSATPTAPQPSDIPF
jgi:hypothetical protein